MCAVPRHALLIALLALLALEIGASASARAQGIGRLQGTVVNGTVDGTTPAGLAVTVHVFQDRVKVGERTVETDSAGHFVVEGLEIGPRYVYFPTVEYGGASYFPARPIELDGAMPTDVEIRVYEPTDAEDVLAFERSNFLVLDVTPQALSIMEMGAVANRSDRTYVGGATTGGTPPTLRFNLPAGAIDVSPQAGLSATALEGTRDGFVSTSPILPGRHEIAFSYRLPFTSPTLDISRRQEYPTATFNLFIPDTGLTVTSAELRSLGINELGGQRYQVYSAQGLTRGSQLSIRLAGLPAIGLVTQQVGAVILGSSAIALSGATFYALRRRFHGHRTGTSFDHSGGNTAESERLGLVRSLAELDERYQSGEIAEERYRAERQKCKGRLVALLEGQLQTR